MKAQTTILFKSILFSILFCAQNLLAQENVPNKYFYYMGGGGEPTGETTIFDSDLKRLSEFVNKSDWQTTISFNGGHKKTEEILQTSFNKGTRLAGDFLEHNYETLVDEMIQKVENGSIKPGDQLMLTLYSHGAQNNGEFTHKISLGRSAATDLTTLAGSKTVALDRLSELAEVASRKGVKLAVMDLSCFSGNTQKIKNDNICVISGTAPDLYSYAGKMDFLFFDVPTTFVGRFQKAMKPGKNLEEIFLEARASGSVPDFPMISTPEGQAVDEKIYRLLSSYLKFNDRTSNHFHRIYDQNDYGKFEYQVCSQNQNYEDLNKIIKTYSNIIDNGVDELLKNEFVKLRDHLEKYRNYQLKYEEVLRKKHLATQELAEYLNSQYPNEIRIFNRYNAADFLNTNFDESIKKMTEVSEQTTDNYLKSLWQNSVKDLNRAKEIIEEVKKNVSPNILKDLEDARKMYADSIVTYDLASNVSQEAKKIYDNLYKRSKRKTSNPCRDFVL